MLSKPFLLSWGAYVVLTFVLGAIWHLKTFKPVYDRLAIYSRLDDPIIPLGLLSMVIQGAILAYLYPHLAGGGGVVAEGFGSGCSWDCSWRVRPCSPKPPSSA